MKTETQQKTPTWDMPTWDMLNRSQSALSRVIDERNKARAQRDELLAALQDIQADAETANKKRNSAEWDFRCTHIEAAAKIAIGKATTP